MLYSISKAITNSAIDTKKAIAKAINKIRGRLQKANIAKMTMDSVKNNFVSFI